MCARSGVDDDQYTRELARELQEREREEELARELQEREREERAYIAAQMIQRLYNQMTDAEFVGLIWATVLTMEDLK